MKYLLHYSIYIVSAVPVGVAVWWKWCVVMAMVRKAQKAGVILARVQLSTVLYQLTRHGYFSYVNEGSLPETYFQRSYEELDNGYVYLLISRTRTLPNDFISLFTNREYNHVSLAFDRELKTIVSYNSGEHIYPPGMNRERSEELIRREGAAMDIYRLPATVSQKRIMLEKIEEINEEGSAYNLLGLVLKTSIKPNMMFCSQFVYTLLELAELNYFEKRSTRVRPTDFVDLDYESRLELVERVGAEM